MKPFKFKNAEGNSLSARLDMPEGPHLATALFAHCFTCGKDIPAARRISGRLATMGIAVLRFDFTGLGHSEGEFANTSFQTNVDDLTAAAAHLRDQGMPPTMMIGHSLGGAAVLKAAPNIPEIAAIVTIGAPFDPDHVTDLFSEAIPKILRDGAADVPLGGRPIRIGKAFVKDISKHNLTEAIAQTKAALLVMHAPNDAIVGIENASQIFLAARHPKSFVSLDKADHLISDAFDAEYTASVIAAWSERYLKLASPAPPPGAPEGVVRASEANPAGFLQDINAGPKHHTLADEPEAYGGSNMGMSPYGFISAGLAACTSMTIRMYARRKGWPLDHVAVDVIHDKVHAQDAGSPGSAKIDGFTRVILLKGALSTDQKERLLEIADRCPVHRTLETSSIVKTHLRND